MGSTVTVSTLDLPIRHLWDGAPADPGEHVTVSLALDPRGLRVTVDAPLHGDPPPPAPPGALWELWEHEVVELFVLGPDGHRYTELELGPHGHHLLLRLEGRRNAVEKLLPVDVTWDRGPTRWRAVAHLDWAVLPPRPWRANAYAVHGPKPNRRYLAWAPVPGAAPDFHALEHFRPIDLG